MLLMQECFLLHSPNAHFLVQKSFWSFLDKISSFQKFSSKIKVQITGQEGNLLVPHSSLIRNGVGSQHPNSSVVWCSEVTDKSGLFYTFQNLMLLWKFKQQIPARLQTSAVH